MPTGFLPRWSAVRTQATMIVVLLVSILAVTGVLTFQAQSTARGQQEAVENILVSHANFAASQYRDIIRVNVFSLHKGLYGGVVQDSSAVLPADFRVAAMPRKYAQDCGCDPDRFIEQHLAYDFTNKTFHTKGGKLTDSEMNQLRVMLKDPKLAPLKDGWMFILARVPGNDKAVYSFAVRVDTITKTDTVPLYAIGFRAHADFLELPLTPIGDFNLKLPQDPILPRSSDRFAIVVTSSGDPLISGGGQPRGAARKWKLQAPFGEYTIQAWVNAAEQELVAGAPIKPPRVPLLVGLLAFASVLTALALVLLKRQSELAQLRAEFVSNVSHELRTPLAQIRMFAETLLLGRVRNDADRRQSLEIIDQEAKRLTGLVENVLQLGRTERGALTVAPTATELAPTVREMVEAFAQLPRSRNVEFRQELEARLVATVDPEAFRQILINLLDNAVKYGPAGQRVHVGLAMFEEHARLWVDDEGAGIPKRDRERVFEPFYRSPVHIASRVAGSGIGLAVVRELATSLQGTAWAEVAPGGGARLIVEFPQAYLRPQEAAAGWAVA